MTLFAGRSWPFAFSASTLALSAQLHAVVFTQTNTHTIPSRALMHGATNALTRKIIIPFLCPLYSSTSSLCAKVFCAIVAKAYEQVDDGGAPSFRQKHRAAVRKARERHRSGAYAIPSATKSNTRCLMHARLLK